MSPSDPAAHPSVPLDGAPRFYEAERFTAEESVGFLMKRILLSMGQQADRRLASHDLTTAQWGPLMRLKTADSMTVAELARWHNTDAGAMTRLLDRLEKKGLCRRERSLQDRRVVHVRLTPEGEAALEHVPAVLSDLLNQHLAGFSHEEWLTLRDLLQRMANNGDRLRSDNP